MVNVVQGTLDVGSKFLNLLNPFLDKIFVIVDWEFNRKLSNSHSREMDTWGKWVELLVFNASRFELHLCGIITSTGVTKFVNQNLSEGKVNG